MRRWWIAFQKSAFHFLLLSSIILFLSCSCRRPDGCHKTLVTYSPASSLAYLDFDTIQEHASRASIHIVLPIIPNPLDAFSLTLNTHLDAYSTGATNDLDVFCAVVVHTPCLVWILTSSFSIFRLCDRVFHFWCYLRIAMTLFHLPVQTPALCSGLVISLVL